MANVTVNGQDFEGIESVKLPLSDGSGYATYSANSSGGSTDAEDGLVERTLTAYSNDRVTTLGNNAFYDFASLKSVDLPNVTTVGNTPFNKCSGLVSVNLPALTTTTTNMFNSCTSLETIELPSVTIVQSKMFAGCSSLKKVSFPSAEEVLYSAFANNSALVTVILGNANTVCRLDNTSAFTGTPIASGTGYVYVPSTLVDSYKAAENWSTYAAQIRAIEDYPDIVG